MAGEEIEKRYVDLVLDDDDEGMVYGDEIPWQENMNDLLMIGRFLTEGAVNYEAMQDTLSRLWRLGRGIFIDRIDANLFSFQFFHEFDMQRILDGGPWTFDHHFLLWEKVEMGKPLAKMDLVRATFWVQLHDVPIGFQSERVCKDLGNFIGEYVESDPRNFDGGFRRFLRIRVIVDVRNRLKEWRNIKRQGTGWYCVNFKYEKLPGFCFICGRIGHNERFCNDQYDVPKKAKLYGPELRAQGRNSRMSMSNKWLRNCKGEVVGGEAMVEGDSMQVDDGKVAGADFLGDGIGKRSNGGTRGDITGVNPALVIGESSQIMEGFEGEKGGGYVDDLNLGGIVVNDPKRKRIEEVGPKNIVDGPNIGSDGRKANNQKGSVTCEGIESLQMPEGAEAKNEAMAGPGFQARQLQ